MWIVRLALRRPYTFIVASILILILGPVAILRTPTDIFPNIDIPIVSVLWQYNGLAPEEMSERIVYPYERTLTTTVNNIAHIDSQSWNGRAIIKIYFQPGADIGNAVAQVTAVSQTAVRQLPPGTNPPLVIQYNASTVPILQLALSGAGFKRTAIGRPRAELRQDCAGDPSWCCYAVSIWRKTETGRGGPESSATAGPRSLAGGCCECHRSPKSDSSRRNRKNWNL